jgi:hypothetical protein
MEIHVSKNGTWEKMFAKRNHVLLIGDGASTVINSRGYSEFLKTFDVVTMKSGPQRTKLYNPSQVGPVISLNSRGRPTYDLAGFGHEVGKAILKRPPAIVVCGSRGGLIVMGVVMQNYWRGAIVMLNAGCLVSENEIPKEVFPCFVTFGNDYWETKNPEYTFQQFKHLAKCERGLLIHYPNETHLPSTDTLKHFITQATELSMLRADNAQVQRFWVPSSTPCKLFELSSTLKPILTESFSLSTLSKNAPEGPFHPTLWSVTYEKFAASKAAIDWTLDVLPKENEFPKKYKGVDPVKMLSHYGAQFIMKDIDLANASIQKKHHLRLVSISANEYSEQGKPQHNRFSNSSSASDKFILVYHGTNNSTAIKSILQNGFHPGNQYRLNTIYGKGTYVATLPLDAAVYGKIGKRATILVCALRVSPNSLFYKKGLPSSYMVVPNVNDLLPMFQIVVEVAENWPSDRFEVKRTKKVYGLLGRLKNSTMGGRKHQHK